MKRLFILPLMAFLIGCLAFSSCKESEAHMKARNKNTLYFTQYVIKNRLDSVNTGLMVLIGDVDGHRYAYHIYSGKNKCYMDVRHLTEQCKKCNPPVKK
jgi:hypothetical protein